MPRSRTAYGGVGPQQEVEQEQERPVQDRYRAVAVARLALAREVAFHLAQ